MEAIDQRWRKSSYSGNGGGNCVEVSTSRPGIIAVRDSKNPHGPSLTFGKKQWATFVTALRNRSLS